MENHSTDCIEVKPEAAGLREFLGALGFDPDALSGFEVRIVGPSRKGRSWWPVRLDSLWDIVESASREKAAVYFGVAKRRDRRGDKKHCVSAGALWSDLDGKCFDPADVLHGKALAFAELGKRLPEELQPSIVINSGGGLHCYWVLREPYTFDDAAAVEAFEAQLRGLAAHLGGDPAVCDVAHVMRAPGSLNFKDAAGPRLATFVTQDTGRRYDLDDLPMLAPPKARVAPALFAEGESVKPDEKVREGARNATATKLAGAMRRHGASGKAIAVALSLDNQERYEPALGAEEIIGIASSIAKYEPGAPEIGELETPPAAAAALEERFEVRYINPVSHRVTKPASHIADVLFPGYTCISGAPKCGKTLVTLAMTLALHTGTAVWGRAAAQANVAWLELDMPEGGFQDYSDRVAAGMDIPQRPLPYFAHGFVDLTDSRQQRFLCGKLRELGTQVLVIDSVRAASSIDENDSNAVRTFVRGFILQRLRNELGVSVIAVAHSPKYGSGPRGSGEWAGGADSLWDVKRPGGRDIDILTVTGTGRHAAFELNLELVVGGLAAKVIEVPSEEARQRVLGHVLEGEGMLAAARALAKAHPGGLTHRILSDELRRQGFKFSQNAVTFILKELRGETVAE